MRARIVPRSLAVKLSVLFALASAVIFASIGVYLYGALARELAARNEEHLTSMTELVRHVLEDVPSADALLENPSLVTHLVVGHHDLRLTLYARDGRPYLSSSGTPLPPDVWTYVKPPDAERLRRVSGTKVLARHIA